MGATRGPDFPISEGELYKDFIHNRFVLGVPQDEYDLRKRMREIVNTLKEGTEEKRAKFTYSDGWLTGFKRRHRISSQKRTEKKSKTFRERRQAVYAFHMGIWCLQNIIHPLRDRIWGYWTPQQIYHVDQIPLPFYLGSKRSLNPRGSYCWIRDVGKGGLDKRQASIILTICAEGPQDVKCLLIVAGTGRKFQMKSLNFTNPLSMLRFIFSLKHGVMLAQ